MPKDLKTKNAAETLFFDAGKASKQASKQETKKQDATLPAADFTPWKSRPDEEPRTRRCQFKMKASIAAMLIELSIKRVRSMNGVIEQLISEEYARVKESENAGKQAKGGK